MWLCPYVIINPDQFGNLHVTKFRLFFDSADLMLKNHLSGRIFRGQPDWIHLVCAKSSWLSLTIQQYPYLPAALSCVQHNSLTVCCPTTLRQCCAIDSSKSICKREQIYAGSSCFHEVRQKGSIGNYISPDSLNVHIPQIQDRYVQVFTNPLLFIRFQIWHFPGFRGGNPSQIGLFEKELCLLT